MPATTGFQAGTETNAVQVSFAVETAWGVAPAVAFQAVRLTGESMSGTKKRDRPPELGQTEASFAVTTEESAGGTLNFGLSYGTFDEIMACAMNSEWQAPVSITGVSGDITMTSGTNVLSSTTTNKFQVLNVGQWIRTSGFTNDGNNTVSRIVAKANNQTLTISLSGTQLVTETPTGALARVRAGRVKNGDIFRSLYVQKQLSPTLYLNYPGSYVSGFTLSGGVGQFLSGSFTLLSKNEAKATVNGSTGPVLAAPVGRVHDPVANFGWVRRSGITIDAVVDSFSLTVTSEGAVQTFGMGDAAAAGVISGRTLVSGMLKVYFKNFTLFDLFTAETSGLLSIYTRDSAGAGYVIDVSSSVLMNPKIVAGGPNQAVYAEFEIEGNPNAANGTIAIDRL